MADTPLTNWTRATMLIWEADDQELALIIQIVTDFELAWGRRMTAAELRQQLHPERVTGS